MSRGVHDGSLANMNGAYYRVANTWRIAVAACAAMPNVATSPLLRETG